MEILLLHFNCLPVYFYPTTPEMLKYNKAIIRELETHCVNQYKTKTKQKLYCTAVLSRKSIKTLHLAISFYV